MNRCDRPIVLGQNPGDRTAERREHEQHAELQRSELVVRPHHQGGGQFDRGGGDQQCERADRRVPAKCGRQNANGLQQFCGERKNFDSLQCLG